MKTSKRMIRGLTIYQAEGKAGEYSPWACNLYNGCSNRCTYCFNNTGKMAATVGGDTERLKRTLVDEAHAFSIFSKELLKWRDMIIRDGGLHFSFVSDPCNPVTIELNWKCISLALSEGSDHYKIGILSGKKNYTPQDIREFVAAVQALAPKSVYWKKSLLEYVQK